MTRGALPGRKPATRVRRLRRFTASPIAALSRSGGSSISSWMELFGKGVIDVFIVPGSIRASVGLAGAGAP